MSKRPKMTHMLTISSSRGVKFGDDVYTKYLSCFAQKYISAPYFCAILFIRFIKLFMLREKFSLFLFRLLFAMDGKVGVVIMLGLSLTRY
jgi:hypothetical protein